VDRHPAPHSDGTVYSAPAIAVSGNGDGSGSLGTYVAVEGPDHSLRDYWNIAGVPTWDREKVTPPGWSFA
jgi:hypothetical protein